MITQELDLNMVPGTVPPVINVSQFDTGARTFKFYLYNGATLFNGAVASCRIEGIKPDGKGFSYNASYSNGVVTADCTEQMTAVSGNVLCEIRLLENTEKVLGTLNFTLCVEKSPLNEDTDISETEIPAIIDLARRNAQQAANSASQAASSASAAANSASQAENIKTDLLNHLNQIDANTSNISQLRTDVNKNTSNISGLRTDVNRNTADIAQLRIDVDRNTDDLDFAKRKNDEQDEKLKGLRTELDETTYKADRAYDTLYEDAEGTLFVKQGFLRFLQGTLTINGKVPKDDKLNRPKVNPAGDLNQLLASNGDGTNSNKWVNLDDLLRDSPFIQHIIAMIISESGVLTVDQGQLTVSQGRLKARTIT